MVTTPAPSSAAPRLFGAESYWATSTTWPVGADPRDLRFESTWGQVIESFEAHRPALVASFEAFVQAEHSPELRKEIAARHEETRFWLVELFRGIGGTAGEGSA